MISPKLNRSLTEVTETWLNSIAKPGEDYQIGAAEALLISNGSKLNELLADGGRPTARPARQDYRPPRTCRRSLSATSSRDSPDEDEIAILGDFLSPPRRSPHRSRSTARLGHSWLAANSDSIIDEQESVRRISLFVSICERLMAGGKFQRAPELLSTAEYSGARCGFRFHRPFRLPG